MADHRRDGRPARAGARHGTARRGGPAGGPGPRAPGPATDPNQPVKLHAAVRDGRPGLYRTVDGAGAWVRVDDGPAGETKVLASVSIPTGMGGIFLYAGTAGGLARNPDCY